MKKLSSSNRYMQNSPKQLLPWPWERPLPQLPQDPGVYSFLSSKGEILYIGKARNLRKRIQNYRKKQQQEKKTLFMLQKAKKLKIMLLHSDFESILVEAELIRTHQPKYNLRLKDDKSPIYIYTTDENYPRVLTARKSDLSNISNSKRIFGPFSSSYQTLKVLKHVRRIFPFCNSTSSQKKNKKACFYLHLYLCPGACTKTISVKDYASIISNLTLFLSGETSNVIKELENKMKRAANKKDFEKAAKLRDQLHNINNLNQISLGPDLKVAQPHKVRLLARRKLWQYISPFFSKSISSPPTKPFQRIEAYDVSNIQGKYATASMIVFTNGLPDKSQYRRFRIRIENHPDDSAMISETLERRLKHREWSFPNLILIDGGKGQVKSAIRVLSTKGLHHKIPTIGLAKQKEILFIYKSGKFHTLNLKKSSNSLKLLMHARDESHRFAKSYHKIIRQSSLLSNRKV